MLEPLGLSSTTEAVYRLMLAEPSWGVRQLVDHLAVDEGAVRTSLDELARLALLEPSWDQPGALRPVSPQVGLARLIANAQADIAQRQRQMEQTKAAMLAVVAEYDAGRDRGGELKLLGLDQVRGRLEELADTVVDEVCSCTPGPAMRPDTRLAGRSVNQRALDRGVQIRGIYQDSFRNDPDTLAYVRWLTELGGTTRTVPTLPMMMVIVDQAIALVPLEPADSSQGAVEVRAKGVVAAVYALFEQLWAMGTPFGEPALADERGLTAQESELVRILAEGATDDTAARRLGLSLRTVRRMMAQIMERLDAHSRFQAGVRAARQGWIERSP